MIPVLFGKDETTFTSLGLGEIDATAVEVERERNGIYSLYMELPFSSDYVALIEQEMQIKADAGARTKWQTFKVNRVIKDTDKKIVKVYADHISMDTINDAMRPRVAIRQQTAEGALRQWNANRISAKQYDVSSDITTVSGTTWTIDEVENARQALGGVEGSILDVWGGEFEFDNNRIILHKEMGREAPTVLEYGRNIVSLEYEELIDGVYTSIYPYASYTPRSEDNRQQDPVMVTLDELIVDGDYVGNYQNRRVQIVDFSSEFESSGDNPEIPTQTKLRSLAKSYVKANEVGAPKITQEVDFVDLSKTLDYADMRVMEEIELNDRVPIFYPNIKITSGVKVTKTVWQPLINQYKSITVTTIGALKSSSLNSDLKTSIKDLEKQQKQINNTVPYLINAQGNRIWYTTPDENMEHKIGDTWFKKNGKYTIILKWNGSMWEEVLNDETFITEIEAEVESAISKAEDAQALAVSEAEKALTKAKEDATAKANAIKEQISGEVNTAISTAESAKALAVSEAEQALADANKYADEQDALIKQQVNNSVDTAISKAEDAKQTAETSYSNAVAEAERLAGEQSTAFNKKFEENTTAMSTLSQEAKNAEAKAKSALEKAGVNANLLDTHQNTLNTIKNTTIPNVNKVATDAMAEAKSALNSAGSAMSEARTALSSASLAMDEAKKADGKIADYVTKNGLVNGTTVDSKIDTATGEISKKITTVESKIPTEIGGRNLIPNTELPDGYNDTYLNFGVSNSRPYSGTGYTDTFAGQTTIIPKGEDYVVSFYAKASANVETFCYFYNPNSTTKSVSSTGQTTATTDGRVGVSITTEWQRYWVRWKQNPANTTTKKSLIVGRNMNVPSGTVVNIAGVKLEQGTIPSDWTPAPEDNYTQEEFKIFESTYDETVKGINSTLTELSTKKVDGTTYQNFYDNEYKKTAQGVTDTYAKVNKIIDANGNSTDTFAQAVYERNAERQKASFKEVTKDLVTTTTYNADVEGINKSISTVQGNLDNLQVGGRNLLKRSDLSSDVKILADGEVFVFNNKGASTTPLFYGLNLEKGKYIYHIMMKKPSGDSVASIRFYKNDVTISYYGREQEVDGEWNRIVIPFEVTDETDIYGSQIYNHAFGTTFAKKVEVMYPMIERGTIPTDWSPAPEDMQSVAGLDNNITAIYNNTSSETSKAINKTLSAYTKDTDFDSKTQSYLTNNQYQTASQVATTLGAYTKTTNLDGTVASYLNNSTSSTAGAINTKLTAYQTTTGLDSSVSSLLSNKSSQTAKGFNSKLTAIEGKIPTELNTLNLLNGTKNEWYDVAVSSTVGATGFDVSFSEVGLEVGDEITWSFDYDFGSYSLQPRFMFTPIGTNSIGKVLTNSGRASHTAKIPSGATGVILWLNNNGLNGTHTSNFIVKLRGLHLSKGSIGYGWSQSANDVLLENDFTVFKNSYESTVESINTELTKTAKKTDLEGMVTESTLSTKNFVTAGSMTTTLSNYAQKNSVPTNTQFNTLKNSYDSMVQTIGTNGSKIAQMVMTDSVFKVDVADKLGAVSTYTKIYSVNTANPKYITDLNGDNLNPDMSYDITLGVRPTGTVTHFFCSLIPDRNGSWNLIVHSQGGTSSNHPYLEIAPNGQPRVGLYGHTSFYDVYTTVTQTASRNKSALTMLSDNINLKVSKDDLISEINLSKEGVLIAGKNIQLDGNVSMTQYFQVPSANIKELTADKITGTTAQFTSLRSNILTADVITSNMIKTDKAFFDMLFSTTSATSRLVAQGAWITNANIVSLDASKITAGTIATARLDAGAIVTAGLTTNVVKANHIESSTGLIDKIFATDALITRLTSNTIFASKIKAITIDASKITSGTIATARLDAGAIVTAGLSANVIKSEHILGSTALIDKIFADDAYIKRLTGKTAFISSIQAIDISASKITSGTLDASKVTVTNLDASSITANQANLVKAGLKGSSGGTLELSGDQLLSTASDGSQVYLQNGVTGTRNPQGATVGQIGYAYESSSPWYSMQISHGSHFQIRMSRGDGQLNKQAFYIISGGTESYLNTDNIYLNPASTGRVRVQGAMTVDKDLRLEGAILVRSRLEYLNGGYIESQAANSNILINATNKLIIYTNGTNALEFDANNAVFRRKISDNSDIRLKTNIVDMPINSLEAIRNIEIKKFDYLDGRKNYYGIIAQQAQQYLPELINTDSEGYLMVDKSAMTYVNMHAIQQLNSKVDNEISQLKAQIANLQDELALLKGA